MAVSHKYNKWKFSDPEMYTPSGGRTPPTDAEVRAEYSRLRSVARKRLERFAGTEYTDTQVYRQNRGKFRPVKELSNREMRYLLADLRRFLSSERSSVAGLRDIDRRELKTLREHGININKSGLPKFRDFMEYARMRSGSKHPDSDRPVAFFTAHQDLSPGKLRKAWEEYEEELYNGTGFQNDKPRRSQAVRRKLGIK